MGGGYQQMNGYSSGFNNNQQGWGGGGGGGMGAAPPVDCAQPGAVYNPGNPSFNQLQGMPPPVDCAQPGAVYNPAMNQHMGAYGNALPPPTCAPLPEFGQMAPPLASGADPNCAAVRLRVVLDTAHSSSTTASHPPPPPPPLSVQCESKDLPFDPRFEAPPGFPEFAGVKAGYIEAYM
jgi:hypothetical protein